MTAALDRIHLVFEANYPMIFGGIAAAAALAYAPQAISVFTENEWKIDSIYSAVFDVSAITTPFLFTFYSFVATAERGFIGRMRASVYYRMLMQYTVRALLLGGLLTLLSIPVMVIEPKPATLGEASHLLLVIWLGLAVWTLSAFVRAAYIFSVFARNQH